MKKSFAVIGLGRFGLSLVQELAQFTDNIIAIDRDEASVNAASNYINQCFIMESTDEKQLKSIGMDNVDHAIICFGNNLEGTILTLVSLKNLGVNQITVRCDRDAYLPILEKLGATDIISPQKLAGIRLANRVVSNNFADYFKLTSDYCIVEVRTPKSMNDLGVLELDARNRFGVNIILIKRGKDSFAPKATDAIKPGDKLFVVGTNAQILKFSDFLGE